MNNSPDHPSDPTNPLEKPWTIEVGPGPIIAAALHAGHGVSPQALPLMNLSNAQRRHEEDPFTEQWTTIVPTRIVVHRSRFECDMNRPRDKAIYLQPSDAWGLEVWKSPPPPQLLEASLAIYDRFYSELRRLLDDKQRQYGQFIVLDLHSYNHRRGGPHSLPEDPARNPEVNIGTGTMPHNRWTAVVDRLISDLRDFDFQGRRLDVRENVRFRGGYFPRWIHENYPHSGCAPAIEVKKIYMDEWTGQPYPEIIDTMREALAASVPGLIQKLRALAARR